MRSASDELTWATMDFRPSIQSHHSYSRLQGPIILGYLDFSADSRLIPVLILSFCNAAGQLQKESLQSTSGPSGFARIVPSSSATVGSLSAEYNIGDGVLRRYIKSTEDRRTACKSLHRNKSFRVLSAYQACRPAKS